MKNSTLLLLTACLLGTGGLKAQIIVTQADFPVVGDKFVVVNDSNPAISLPLPSGASVTWSYGSLATTTIDTLTAILPSATGYSAIFPASNIALSYSLPGIKYAFINLASGELAVYGAVEPVFSYILPVVYKPQPQKLYSFPMDYESSWNGGYSYRLQTPDTATLYDSIRVMALNQYNDTVESWGNCTTPTGTYGTLRVREIDRGIDSVWGNTRNTPHTWIYITRTFTSDTVYTWVANGLGYPLLSMHILNGKVHYASWLKSVNAGIEQITDNAGSLVYPNPANNVLNIKLASCQNGSVVIMDITGRQISTTEFSNKLANINTSALTGGMYFYRVSDKNGNTVDAGKFIVTR